MSPGSPSGRSSTGARLIDVRVPDDADSLVLVLHGGASRGPPSEVSPTQLSVLRMVPLAHRLTRSSHRSTAVFRLLNSRRGWDPSHDPVSDVEWAVDTALDRLGDVPVALVGHSLGGRAALMAGVLPPVRGVVALNPWVYPQDDVDLSGRRVLIVHGTRDSIARPQSAARVADRIATRTDVRFVEVEGGRHAMLRHGSTYERLAATFVTTLFESPTR